jgi:hypothetical protein
LVRQAKFQILFCLLASLVCSAQHPDSISASFSRVVPEFSLNDETVFDGLAKLNGISDLGFSVERELTSREHPTLAAVIRFSAKTRNASVRELLDWLCELDPRYVWSTDGQVVNFYPRDVQSDNDYPLNRRISAFDTGSVTSITSVVMQVTKHTSPPEQLAVMQIGSDEFSVPKQLSFKDTTLREALNQIAEGLGASYGWQFSGTRDFRYLVFHKRLILDSTKKAAGAKERRGSADERRIDH